jgi:hypothetical protein
VEPDQRTFGSIQAGKAEALAQTPSVLPAALGAAAQVATDQRAAGMAYQAIETEDTVCDEGFQHDRTNDR